MTNLMISIVAIVFSFSSSAMADSASSRDLDAFSCLAHVSESDILSFVLNAPDAATAVAVVQLSVNEEISKGYGKDRMPHGFGTNLRVSCRTIDRQ